MKYTLRSHRLTQRGVLHQVLPLLFIVVFATVGVGYLVYSHAASSTTTPEIKSVGLSGDCIDVVGQNGNSTVPNAKVNLAECNNSAPQNISVSGSGSTTRLLFNGSYCLEPKGGVKTVGAYVVSNTVSACSGNASNKTEYWKAASGGYENVGASLCLTATSSASHGLQLQKCASTNLQKWTAVAGSNSSTGGTSGGTGTAAYCKTGGAQLWSNLASCGWPNASNTGPVLSQCPDNKLTTVTGSLSHAIDITKAGTTLSCENISGMVYVNAPNVTIKNIDIESNSGKTGEAANGTADIFISDGASATIENANINGDDGVHACIWDQGTSEVVEAVNCYGVDDGIWSWPDTSYSQTTGDHFTIKNSYFHDFTTKTSNGHEDGYQTEGAANGTIDHNTYQLTTSADSDVAIWDSLKSSSNITVENNLMTGGGFAIYAEDYSPSQASPSGGFTTTNIQFDDNDFSTQASGCVGQYGVWFTVSNTYKGGPTDGWHRSGNKVLETGQNIDSGNPTNKGALCD